MNRIDQRDNLASFEKPAIVICGTQDVLTPPTESQETASLLPNAELVLLENIAHMSTMEAPESVNEALLRWYGKL